MRNAGQRWVTACSLQVVSGGGFAPPVVVEDDEAHQEHLDVGLQSRPRLLPFQTARRSQRSQRSC